MRRYALDTRTANPHFPGIGRYVTSLGRAMVSCLDENEQLVLLRDPAGNDPFGVKELESERVHSADVRASPFSLRQQWTIPHLLRELHVDLYHSPYYLMPYCVAQPTVLTVYDLIPLRLPLDVSFRARILFRLATALALRAASHVVTSSQATRHDMLAVFRLSARPVQVIPLAADPAFHPSSADEVERVRAKYGLAADYVLYVGSNKPHKNLTRLVEAWSLVHLEPFRLVIAGPWDPRYAMPRQRVVDLELQQSVRFLGRISEQDLPALYSGATAFVFPSLYEGFGLPVLEAMACGVPVACSRSSSLPEVAGESALYFDPTEMEDIAQALQKVLTDLGLRHRLATQALARAAEFSWGRTAWETLKVYRRICA